MWRPVNYVIPDLDSKYPLDLTFNQLNGPWSAQSSANVSTDSRAPRSAVTINLRGSHPITGSTEHSARWVIRCKFGVKWIKREGVITITACCEWGRDQMCRGPECAWGHRSVMPPQPQLIIHCGLLPTDAIDAMIYKYLQRYWSGLWKNLLLALPAR